MKRTPRSRAITKPAKPFSLLVKPAGADCNLGCTYCFYLPKRSLYPGSRVPRMNDEVLDALIRGYMATEQPVYSFGWQGGEPTLMGVEFYRKVTKLQQKYGRPGSRVANGLQTNATLIDDELAQHLADHRILVGVSIDGPVDAHDTYRTRGGGTGTHEQVMAGVDRLRNHGVDVNALVLVSRANVHRAGEVYGFLKSHELLYHQYIPCVEFEPSGEPSPFSITGKEWGEFLRELFALWSPSDTRRVSVRHHDALMAFFLDGTSQICTIGGRCDDYFVVEHTGDVYPCDFFVEPELKLGNVTEDDWGALSRRPEGRKFAVRKAAWPEVCETCSHLPYCSGDCIKHRAHAPIGAGSWLCTGWKDFYDMAAGTLRSLAENVSRERGLLGPLWDPVSFDPEAPCYCRSGRKAKNCHLRSVNQSTTALQTVSRSTP
ncbi:MAG: anaerobic sulfatase maturase [Spirochaetia bacterium]